MISFSEAHEHLRYVPSTGKLWWRVRASGRRMNKPAGAKANGYVQVAAYIAAAKENFKEFARAA